MFPIHLNTTFNRWFVWSMRVEHTTDGEHLSKGLELFQTYDEGMEECIRRNDLLKEKEGE